MSSIENLLTECVTTDEESGIALITQTNHEWAEEYQRLFFEHKQLMTSYDTMESTCKECQRENVKIKRQMELLTEKYSVERDGLTRQKEDVNIQNEKLRAELREKNIKIGDLQKSLVERQRKADSHKEELLSKVKLVEKLEIAINDLQNKTILELKQKLNKSEATLEVVQKRSTQLSLELNQADDQCDEYERSIEKLRQEKIELMEKLTRAEYDIRMAVDARNKAEEKVSSLQEIERSLREKNSQFEADILAAQSKIRDLENELNKRQAQAEESSYNITVVQNDVSLQSAAPEVSAFVSLGDDMSNEEKGTRRKNFEELSIKVKQLEGENYDLKGKLDIASKDRTRWENKYENEIRERNKITIQLESEMVNYGRLRNEHNDLISKMAKAERLIGHDKREIIEKDGTIKDLKAKIAQLQKDIDAREDTIAKLEMKLEQLRREMEMLHEDVLEHQRKYGDLNSDHKVSEQEKESVQRDFDQVSIRIGELESKSRESEEEKKYLQKENADLRQKLLRLEGELDTTFKDKTVFENQLQEWSEKSTKERKIAENLKKRFAQAQEEVEQYKNELMQVNTKIDEFLERLSELKSQYDASQTDLLSARADCEYKDDEIKRLKTEIYDRENNISKLEAQLEKALNESNKAEVELAGVLEKLQHSEIKRADNEDQLTSVDVIYSNSQTRELQSDLAPLRRRIYELENENNRLQTIEEHLHSDIKDSENKIASLRRDLNRANAENDDWERKAADLENKINILEKAEDDLNRIITDLQGQKDELNLEVDKLHKKVETLTLERDKLKEYLNDYNSKLTQSKQEHNDKSLEFSEQVKVNTTLKMTVEKHEANLQALTQRCRALEEELEHLRPELRTALNRNETMEKETKDLDSRTKVQKQTIEDLQKELREEIDNKELLEQEVDSLTYKLTVAEGNSKALTKQRSDLQSQIDDLETKLRKIKPEMEQCRNKLKDKNRIISRFDAEIKDKDSQLKAAKRKISTLEDTVTSTRKELEANKSTNEINRNRVQELQIQLQEMSNTTQTAVAKAYIVQSALPQSYIEEGFRSTSDERVQDLEILLKKSESREGELREQLQRLEHRLPRVEIDAKAAQGKVKEIQRNVNTLQKKLEEARKMLDRSNRERDDAKKELMEARTKLTLLETKGVADGNEILSLQSQLDQARQRLEETHNKLLSLDEDHVHLRLEKDVHDKEKEDYTAAVGKLKGKKLDLEQRVELLESSLKSSKLSCDALREEKSKAQQELNELRQTTLADLKKNLTRMLGERDRALEDYRAAMLSIEDLDNELAEAAVKRKELERDNDDLNSEIRHLMNEIEANRTKIEEIGNNSDTVNLQIQEYEKDIDELREAKKRLEDEVADLQVKLAEKQDVINSSSVKVVNVEATYAEAPGFEFGSHQDTFQDLTDVKIDLKEKLKRVEMEYNNSQEQLNDYKIRLGDAEEKKYHLESELKDAESQIKDLEMKLQETSEELKFMTDQYQSVGRELELLKEELQGTQTKLSTAEAQQVTVAAKLGTVQQQLDAAQKDLLDKNSVVVEKQRKINEFYAILESGDKDSDRLKQVIEELREDSNAKDRDNEKLQKYLRVAEENVTKLHVSVEEIEAKLHDTEHEREEYKMKVDGFEVELEMRNQALEEAQREVNDSRDKFKASKKEIVTLRSQLKEANANLKAAGDARMILEGRIGEHQAVIDRLRKELSAGATSQSGNGNVHIDDLKNKLQEYSVKLQDLSNEKMKLELELREKDAKITHDSVPSGTSHEEQDHLKDEVINLQATLKEVKKNYQKSQRDAEELQRRLVAKDNEIKRYEDKIGKVQDENEKLKKDCANLEKKNSDLKIEYEKLKYEKNKSENELSLLKKKFQALQNQLNVVDVSKQNQDFVSRQKYQELEVRCQDALREREKSRSEMAAYRTKMASLEAELNEQKSAKHILEVELHRLRNIETELKTKLQTSRNRHKEDKDKMLDWRKKNFSPLEQELQRAKGLIKKFEKLNAAKDHEIEDLKDDVTDREKRIANLEYKIEGQDVIDARTLDSVNIDIRGDSQAVKRALDGKADAVKEAQKLKNTIWTMEHDMDILKTKGAQQEKLVAEVNSLNDKLKDELRQLKKGDREQQRSFKLDAGKSEFVYQLNTLKEDKEELEKDNQELRDELNEVRSENLKLMMESKDLRLDLQQLEIKLRELETGHKLVKEDNDKIRSDLLLFQNENRDLKENLNRWNDNSIQVQAVTTVETVESVPSMMFDDDLDEIKQTKDKLKIELEAAEDQVRMLQTELENKQTRNDTIKVELIEVKRIITEYEVDIKKLNTELENLHHELDLANQNYEYQRNENQVLLDTKENLLEGTKELHTEVKGLEMQLQNIAKEKAELERQIKNSDQTPTERQSLRDVHNEKETRISELMEKASQLEHFIEKSTYQVSTLEEENNDLKLKINTLKDENNELHTKLSQFELDIRRDHSRIMELEKENQELQEMLGKTDAGGIDSGAEKTELVLQINTLNDRNTKLQTSLEQAKKDKAEFKKQLDEYSNRYDDTTRQLAVQITKFGGNQSVSLRNVEYDEKIEKLKQEKLEISMTLESLKEELKAAKSNFSDIQKQNETLRLEITTLTEDNVKLDNKLVEEMNSHKVKIAEMEAEQDFLSNKINGKDNLVDKLEIQVQQLREQLATSVSSEKVSTTLVIDVSDKRRRQRPLGLSSSYKEGLMTRFGGLYRSTSEGRMPSEHYQAVELLSKQRSRGDLNNTGSTEHLPKETVVSTSTVTTKSQLESTTQDSNSSPTSDDKNEKIERKEYDKDSGNQEAEKGTLSTVRGKDRNRADCKQN